MFFLKLCLRLTFFNLRANNYTTKQLMLLKGTFFFKLCTNDYITITSAQAGIEIAGRNIINFRHADDTTLWQKAKKNYRAF